MSRLPIGLVGAGRWGSNYIGLLANHADFDLVGVVDSDHDARARARALAPQTQQFPALTDLAGAGARAVVIATPSETHADLTLQAFGLGLDVLVEKPLATSAADASRLHHASSGRTILVGHLTLHCPAIMRLLDELRGRPQADRSYHVRVSTGDRSRLESPIWALAPHDVALSFRLMGDRPTEVRSWHAGDTTRAVLRYPRGRESHFTLSRSAVSPERQVEVLGEGYSIRAGERTGLLEITSTTGTQQLTATGAPPLQGQCEHFHRCVLFGEMPIETFEAAVSNVRVLAALTQSVSSGGAWVSIQENATRAPGLNLPPLTRI